MLPDQILMIRKIFYIFKPYLKASKHCAAHGAKILICISDDLCVRNTLYRLQTCERSECAAAA